MYVVYVCIRIYIHVSILRILRMYIYYVRRAGGCFAAPRLLDAPRVQAVRQHARLFLTDLHRRDRRPHASPVFAG